MMAALAPAAPGWEAAAMATAAPTMAVQKAAAKAAVAAPVAAVQEEAAQEAAGVLRSPQAKAGRLAGAEARLLCPAPTVTPRTAPPPN